MKATIRVSWVFLAAGLLLFGSTGEVQSMVYPALNDQTPQPFIIKGLVSVQFEDNVNLNGMNKSFGKVSFGIPSLDLVLDANDVSEARPIFSWHTEKPAVNSGVPDLTRFYELKIPETAEVMQVVNELMQNPNVRMAEPVWAMPLLASPNDPQWSNQWAMEPGPPDPNFYTAWDLETGSDSIKIGLIDSGVKHQHGDLKGNVWVNPGEDLDGDGIVYDVDDLNNIDDDGNGVVDDLIGYDFFTGLGGGVWPGEDGGLPDTDPDDFNGHGTHVAGIVAACTNNNLDVTGVAGGWFGGNRAFRGVRLMCLRVGATGADGNGYVNTNNCATAMLYAADNGANVMNASWGSSSILSAALSAVLAAGMTVCHAAGNDNMDDPDFLDFGSGVLSIASSTSSDAKSGFSNWGTWIDVSAPGSSIYSTYSFSGAAGLATLSGTSMASPMVAGLAALIRSQMPSLSKDQVDSIIVYSANFDDFYAVNPTWVGLLGSGRIDALVSLQDLANAKFEADVTFGSAPLVVQFTDLSPNSPVSWDWSFGTGDGSTDQNPQYTYTDPGIYSVSLVIDESNPLGPGEEYLNNYIWVTADTMEVDSVGTTFAVPVTVPVYLTNTALIKEIQFPFSFANSIGVSFDSVSVTGTRADYFESVTLNAVDLFNKRVSVLMKTNSSTGSNYLAAGSGAILNLHFTAGTTLGIVAIDTMTVSGKIPKITTIYGDYWPDSFGIGKIDVTGCCIGIRGNVDDIGGEPGIDIADLLYMVDYQFGSPAGPAPVCEEEGDVDGSLTTDIADLLYMVDYQFGSPTGPAPVSCF